MFYDGSRPVRIKGIQCVSACLAGVIALLGSHVAAKCDVGVSADDLSALQVGQSYVRAFQDYLMPGTCGIVLERQRCRDDFAALQQVAGPRKMDKRVSQWLVDGDLDNRPRDWDGFMIADITWRQNPDYAWWYTVGELLIAAKMPKIAPTADFVSSIVAELAAHPDAAPLRFRDLIGSGDSPFDRIKGLLEALNAAVPASAFPTVSIAAGDRGYAQLGVLCQTLQEMIDNPLTLSRPEARLFALRVIDQIEMVDGRLDVSYSFDDIRQRLRGDIPMDRREVDVGLRQPLTAWAVQFIQKLPAAQRDSFLLGSMTTQTAYNAAILKDKNSDAESRGFISHLKPYVGMSVAATTALGKMQSIQLGAWVDVNAAASAATLSIAGPP